MIKKFFLNLAALTMLFAALSCQKDPIENGPDTPPTPPEEEVVPENGDPVVMDDFTATILSLHAGDVLIDIKPNDKNITYWYSLQIKEDMPETDEEIIQADKDYFDYLCRYYGITIEELLGQNLVSGDHDWRYRGLNARTEYVFYVYGIQNDGTPTTGVNQFTFETPKVEEVECTFDIVLGDNLTSTSFSITILPSDENVGYFYDIMPTFMYEEYCQSNPENIPAFIETYIPALAAEYGYSVPEVVGMISAFGPLTDDFDAEDGIEPSTSYFVFAIGIGADGSATTQAEVLEVVTANPPTNTFDVVAGSIYDDRASFYITPDHNETFVALYELQEYMYDLNGNPLSDEQIIEEILASRGELIYEHVYYGSSTIFECPLIPEKDYWCLVFGFKNGEVTTPLTKVGFTTTKADANDTEFIVSVGNITTTTADVSFQPYIEPTPHMFNYMPYSTYEAYGANDDAIKRFNDELIDQLWDPSVMSKEEWLSRALETGYNSWKIEGLEPETKYLIYAIGIVPDGTYTTRAFTSEFTTKEVKEGPQIKEVLFVEHSSGENVTVAGWFYFENGTNVAKFKMTNLAEDRSLYDLSDSELIEYLAEQNATDNGIFVAEVTNQTYMTVYTYNVPSGKTVYYAGAIYDGDGNYTIVRTTYTTK